MKITDIRSLPARRRWIVALATVGIGLAVAAVLLLAPSDRETWEICSIEGVRAGYTRTTVKHVRHEGRRAVRVEGLNHLVLRRFGTPVELDLRFWSLETPEGRLLECETAVIQGSTSMITHGRVAGDRLQFQITTQGNAAAASIPWSADYGGFDALQQSLRRTPLKPGQRRTIRALEAGSNQLATTELTAGPEESVSLPSGAASLLRIDARTRLGEETIIGRMWTDPSGEILKSHTDLMNLEMVRATEADALGNVDPAEFDVTLCAAVPLQRPIEHPHQTRRVRYRVHLDGSEPARAFCTGPSQQVRRVDAHTAEITVFALRPGDASGNSDAPNDPPGDGDRQPNSMIQSDNPVLVEAAKAAVGQATDPWQQAVALERFVRERITEPTYSQGFASAAEAFEKRKGDCRSHAVLLVALARAVGIPARAAYGLVYQNQAFLFHLWTEVYVEGRWIPIDATLAQGGIGAAHLKVGHTNFQGASPLAGILPVAQVIGRLKIEVLEAE
jgi:hypothetical protein